MPVIHNTFGDKNRPISHYKRINQNFEGGKGGERVVRNMLQGELSPFPAVFRLRRPLRCGALSCLSRRRRVLTVHQCLNCITFPELSGQQIFVSYLVARDVCCFNPACYTVKTAFATQRGSSTMSAYDLGLRTRAFLSSLQLKTAICSIITTAYRTQPTPDHPTPFPPSPTDSPWNHDLGRTQGPEASPTFSKRIALLGIWW